MSAILTTTDDDAGIIPIASTVRDKEEYTLPETIGASFRSVNSVVSNLDVFLNHEEFERDPEYDITADEGMKEYIEKYPDWFVGVSSEKEAKHILSRVNQMERDNRIRNEAGLLGITTDVAAGLIDPTILMPGGAIYKSYKAGGAALRSFRSTATAGFAAGALYEGAMHTAKPDRTIEESFWNISAETILSGLLGAGASRLLSRAESKRVADKVMDYVENFDETEAFDKLLKETDSLSAAAVARGDGKLKDHEIIEKLPLINRQDPMIRLFVGMLDAGRNTVRELAESPYTLKENLEGTATSRGGAVESRMKAYDAALGRGVDEMYEAYSRYFYGKDVGGVKKRFAPLASEIHRSHGKLTFTEFSNEVGRAMRRGDVHEIPEVAAAAKMWRKNVFDEFKVKAIHEGLLPEDIDVTTSISYLTRVYNKQKIIANRVDFEDRLLRYFMRERENILSTIESPKGKITDLDDDDLKDLAAQVTDHILGTAEGRILYNLPVSVRGPLKERVLLIADEEIEDFLESDINKIAAHYTRTMAPDIELKAKFGDVDLTGEIQKVKDEAAQRTKKAKTEKEATAINKAMTDAIRDIEGIRDRLRGTYGLPENPNSIGVRTFRVIRNLNYMRLLGGMTLSAIPDLGRPVMVQGLTRTLRDGFLPLMTNFQAAKIAMKEVKIAGTAWDMALDTRVMALADITNDYGSGTVFERAVSAASARFGLVSLMAPWNAVVKQVSGMVTMTRILQATQDLAKGKISKKERANLAAASIDDATAAAIAREFEKHGNIEGNVWQANTQAWDNRAAAEAFHAAVVRDVDRMIVTPGQDRPLFASTELGKTLLQFRSFGLSSAQKTLVAGLQQRDAATLNGVILMLGLGAAVYAAKMKVAGRETSDDPAVWAANAIDRSGMLGWIMDANNIVEKFTGGRLGMSAFTGEQISRYATRNVYGALLGPTADAAADIFQVSSALFKGEVRATDLHTARKMVPLQNLFYVRWLFDQLEDAADLPGNR